MSGGQLGQVLGEEGLVGEGRLGHHSLHLLRGEAGPKVVQRIYHGGTSSAMQAASSMDRGSTGSGELPLQGGQHALRRVQVGRSRATVQHTILWGACTGKHMYYWCRIACADSSFNLLGDSCEQLPG